LVCGRLPSWDLLISSIAKGSKMQNLDIIILSSIVTILFGVFFYVIYKELSQPEGQIKFTEDNSPRTKMIRKVGAIFDSEVKSS